MVFPLEAVVKLLAWRLILVTFFPFLRQSSRCGHEFTLYITRLKVDEMNVYNTPKAPIVPDMSAVYAHIRCRAGPILPSQPKQISLTRLILSGK